MAKLDWSRASRSDDREPGPQVVTAARKRRLAVRQQRLKQEAAARRQRADAADHRDSAN